MDLWSPHKSHHPALCLLLATEAALRVSETAELWLWSATVAYLLIYPAYYVNDPAHR